MNLPIDIEKKYTTASGKEVKIENVSGDPNEREPVWGKIHGMTLSESGWSDWSWNEFGLNSEKPDDPLNLVEFAAE